MNRKKIKSEAREMIKGNLWNILKPYAIVILITFLASILFIGIDPKSMLYTVINFVITVALYPLSFGCIVYVMKFVRKEPYDLNLVFSFYKRFWPIFALYFLVGLFTTLWTLAFIIPGIIAAISYSFAPYIMADGEEDAMECIKKSKAMLKGYKWDYVKFTFSFILWHLLGIVTLGIAYVYVVPYVLTAEVLYYDELKKIS